MFNKDRVFFFIFILFLFFALICGKNVHAQTLPEWQHISSKNGQIPIGTSSNSQQTASLILDINKDGTDDFVIADRGSKPSVVWYERAGTSWNRHTIEPDQMRIEAGGDFYDIDGDGDLDVVFGGDGGSNKIWWWENPHPTKNNWTRRTIKNSGANKHHDQRFGDFDGDGQKELASWNQGGNRLLVFEIPSNPKGVNTWPSTTIFTWSSGPQHEGMDVVDVDGNGKVDIVGGGKWFRHTGGTSYQTETVDPNQVFIRAAGGQLIPGGRAELLFGPGDGGGRLYFYWWNGTSWQKKDLAGEHVDHGHSLQVEDIDSDGKLDVFNAEMRLNDGNSDAKTWVFYGDGNGNFTKQIVVSGFGNHESKVGDLDGDGDIDILSKPYNWDTPRIDIRLQKGSGGNGGGGGISLDNWRRHVIDSNKPWKAVFIDSADIDQDGKKDIVTGGWWYKNPGTNSGSWQRNTIGAPVNNMAAIFDIDKDGDLDIFGTQGKATSNQFAWARNNGSGGFDVFTNIQSGNGDFLQGAAVGKFTSSNFQIALSWHQRDQGVQLLSLPSNPVSQTWSHSKISSTSQDEDLSSGDIDRDGDVDLLLGTKWLKNNSSGWSTQTLNPAGGSPDRNNLADINGDSRLDAVVGFEAISKSGKLAWYEQGSNAGNTWPEHIIDNVIGPMSLDAADMDRDGDIDVVVGEHNLANPASARVYVFENKGAGASWEKHIVSTGDEHHDGTQTVDIDGDGDLDIISIGWEHEKVLLYENISAGQTSPSADLDSDQDVDFVDYDFLLGHFGETTAKFDLNKNGRVDIYDLNVLEKEYGR